MDGGRSVDLSNEYLVRRMFADARVQRIYGGTNEIMKELISRAP